MSLIQNLNPKHSVAEAFGAIISQRVRAYRVWFVQGMTTNVTEATKDEQWLGDVFPDGKRARMKPQCMINGDITQIPAPLDARIHKVHR